MYLSRVEIDTKDRFRMSDLSQLGAYHAWVENSFPEEIQNKIRSRKLWRIDKFQGKMFLLIVSDSKPEKSFLEKYGVKDSSQSKEYEPILEKLREGQILRFKTTLNPVHSVSTGKDSGKRGSVYPMVTIGQKMEFLKNRAELNGFSLEDNDFYISDSVTDVLKKRDLKQERISKVTYEGTLRITDLELFKKALITGIGKKKAYGCGLLTVIPIS
ncbi:MAG: type I-E CRISPR-associated protein Cas6/Cse3/CasE [Clostridiaceae bacterium]